MRSDGGPPEAGPPRREEVVEEEYFDAMAGRLDRWARNARRRLGLDPQPVADELGAEPLERRPLHGDGAVSIAVYRRVARASTSLTDGEFRTLDALLSFADSKPVAFANAFPGRKALASRTGGPRKRPTAAVDRFLRGLDRKGWIERIPFVRDDGRFASTGYRFRIPPGEIAEGDPGFEGPAEFGARGATRCRRRRRGHR